MKRIIRATQIFIFFLVPMLFLTMLAGVNSANAATTILPPQNLAVPTLGFTDTTITLIWEKPSEYSKVVSYEVYQNGSLVKSTTKLNYTIAGLTPNTTYNFSVRAKDANQNQSIDSNILKQSTTTATVIFNVLDYGAVGDGSTINTKAIQKAIDACSPGGKVVIPMGTFKSGAIFLKSDMTLEINGTLLGSDNNSDYPFTSMRFPYYPTKNYMGLINAYATPYGSMSNVRICGTGTVSGGTLLDKDATLTLLGKLENFKGNSARGDMITVKGVTNLYLGGLTLINPAMHTIFVSYCKNITVDGIKANTYDLQNADGIDLATSDNTKIFNCVFDTGDDCINFNAGVGADGEKEGIACSNIRVFNCVTKRGHGGVVFGSYTAGWIKNVLIEDCVFDGTDRGLRFKTNREHGGGAENVIARDITMKNILYEAIFFDSRYPSAYPAASAPGQFRHITIRNVTCENARSYGIFIYGLADSYFSDIQCYNVTLNNTKGAFITNAKDIMMDTVTFGNSGSSPWNVSDSASVKFIHCSPQPK